MSGLTAFTRGFSEAVPTGIQLGQAFHTGRQRRADRKAGKIAAEYFEQEGATPGGAATAISEGDAKLKDAAAPASAEAIGQTPEATPPADVAPPATERLDPRQVPNVREVTAQMVAKQMAAGNFEGALQARQQMYGYARERAMEQLAAAQQAYELGNAEEATYRLRMANAYVPNGIDATFTMGADGKMMVQGQTYEGELFGEPKEVTRDMITGWATLLTDPVAYAGLDMTRRKQEHIEEQAKIVNRQNDESLALREAELNTGNQWRAISANQAATTAAVNIWTSQLKNAPTLDDKTIRANDTAIRQQVSKRLEDKISIPEELMPLYQDGRTGGQLIELANQLAGATGKITPEANVTMAEGALLAAHQDPEYQELSKKGEVTLTPMIVPDDSGNVIVAMVATDAQGNQKPLLGTRYDTKTSWSSIHKGGGAADFQSFQRIQALMRQELGGYGYEDFDRTTGEGGRFYRTQAPAGAGAAPGGQAMPTGGGQQGLIQAPGVEADTVLPRTEAPTQQPGAVPDQAQAAYDQVTQLPNLPNAIPTEGGMMPPGRPIGVPMETAQSNKALELEYRRVAALLGGQAPTEEQFIQHLQMHRPELLQAFQNPVEPSWGGLGQRLNEIGERIRGPHSQALTATGR